MLLQVLFVTAFLATLDVVFQVINLDVYGEFVAGMDNPVNVLFISEYIAKRIPLIALK